MHPAPAPQTGSEKQAPVQRQFVNFQFFKVLPAWRLLDVKTQETGKAEFLKVIEDYGSRMILIPYSTVGIRPDCDFLLWRISYDLEVFQEMTARLLKTGFGKYLEISYSYLSMTKRSTYVDKLDPGHTESRTRIKPGKFKYIFIYPFLKTRDWYLLPLETRQSMMDEHIRIGTKYTSVKLNTTYSFGLDDQEFIVAFETDFPGDFLDLVQELRESQGSKFTLRDTPTFTAVLKSADKILEDF